MEFLLRRQRELFNIPYFHPEHHPDFEEILLRTTSPHSCLIEITTDRKENVAVHEEIMSCLKTCLN